MRTNVHTEPRRSSGAKSYLVVAVLFTLAAGAAWFSINRDNIQEYMQTYKNREAEMAEIENLKERISELKRKQQSLAYNGMESEKQIRERLQMHKPGEKVVFFVEEGERATTASAGSAIGQPEQLINEPNGVPAMPKGATERTAQPDPAPTGQIRSVYDAM